MNIHLDNEIQWIKLYWKKLKMTKMLENERIKFQILTSPTTQKSELQKNETSPTATPNYSIETISNRR